MNRRCARFLFGFTIAIFQRVTVVRPYRTEKASSVRGKHVQALSTRTEPAIHQAYLDGGRSMLKGGGS